MVVQAILIWVRLFWRDVRPPKPPGAVLVGLGLVLAGGC